MIGQNARIYDANEREIFLIELREISEGKIEKRELNEKFREKFEKFNVTSPR